MPCTPGVTAIGRPRGAKFKRYIGTGERTVNGDRQDQLVDKATGFLLTPAVPLGDLTAETGRSEDEVKLRDLVDNNKLDKEKVQRFRVAFFTTGRLEDEVLALFVSSSAR